jgi:GTP-binding protein
MTIHSDYHLNFEVSISALADWQAFLEKDLHPHLFFFLGRSNVGKSSLINFLFNKKIAHTSQTPGKTKLINVFSITTKNSPPKILGALIDLPGYGHAKISKTERFEWDQLLAAMFDTLDDRSHLFCLQDSRHPFSDMDLLLLDFLASYPAKRTLILTKMDQCKTQKDRHQLKLKIEEFCKSFSFDEKFYVAQKDSQSLHKLQSYIKKLLTLS